MLDFINGVLRNLPDAIGLGLIWGIMVLGVFITFRILDFPDMTVDGSFAMGGCISGGLIVSGIHPVLSIIVAVLGGIAAGFVTGALHTKLKIPGILAGILTMFGLYSINLRILGRPNVGILNRPTVFNTLRDVLKSVFPDISSRAVAIVVGGVTAIAIIALLYWFFGTELGCALRATGCNEYMVRALGSSTDTMKLLGLVIANALVAFSGAIYSQYQLYSDVNMGQGAIVIGLASIVIGEVLFGHRLSFLVRLISVVSGSIIYRIVWVIVLRLGLNTDDMKLFTAIVVALALSLPVVRERINTFIRLRKNAAMYKEGK